MKRRDFLGLLAVGSVPSVAVGQQTRLMRIGVIITGAESDGDAQARLNVFRTGLEKLGWFETRNMRLEVRWGAGSPERARTTAAELIAANCDVILANGSPPVAALRQLATSIPIVFVVVTDPVVAGFVQSLSRPGANITGFSTFEPVMGSKWLELLKEAAPALRRIGCILDPSFTGFSAILQQIEASASRLGLDVARLVLREKSDDIEELVAAFVQESNGGLIISPTAINNLERKRLFAIAEKYRLPAIYPFRNFASDGGLMAYGFDPHDLFRRSATYVDRILKGAKPADLPVQAPDRFTLTINARAAKAIGLTIPLALLARADEVIE